MNYFIRFFLNYALNFSFTPIRRGIKGELLNLVSGKIATNNYKPKSVEGFMMMELLVAILLFTGFLATALELMMFNITYNINIKVQKEGLNWIEEQKQQAFLVADNLSKTKCTDFAIELWKQLESKSTFKTTSRLILDETSAPVEKTFADVNNKKYQLVKVYKIQKEEPEVLIFDYGIVDSTNQKKILQRQFEVRPNASNICY
ncbi:hypothetical protein [Gloeothece verrucosa]|uniref:Uncharacterized protein n=1 Tax=Gloeothece verrucosa (strain PCC 7822) TaxID=497965 RepID=E0ULC5_GLOV7|nr:hypothetical protein [Gloeothece verrucosa]ADN17755.1 hypothetical protein Cyan7822_5901 [Gloeothece verrucosa PCC 7822]